MRTDDDFLSKPDRHSGIDPDEIQGLRAQVRPLAIADAQQAVRYVRQHAEEWGTAPERIGLMGFSAGAMVTAGVGLEHDAESRPTFIAPIYGAPFEDFFGTVVEEVTAPEDAPPMFAVTAHDDTVVSAAHVVRLYGAWHAAGREAELHIYSKGGHGFGIRQLGLPVDSWKERFREWLEVQGLLVQ